MQKNGFRIAKKCPKGFKFLSLVRFVAVGYYFFIFYCGTQYMKPVLPPPLPPPPPPPPPPPTKN